MAKEEPLDEALHELKAIISMLQANLFKMVNTKEVKESEGLLEIVEKAVDEFEKKAYAELEGVGLTREQEDMIREGVIPKDVSGDYREAIQIAMDLKIKIDEMRKIAHEERGMFEESADSEEPSKEDKKQKRISKQQHKKKFKRLGGDDWKPL